MRLHFRKTESRNIAANSDLVKSQYELSAFLKQATTFVLEYKIFMEEIRSLDGTAASVRVCKTCMVQFHGL
jgi:hypothetical protein